MTETLPTLYILARNDMASMNPGKLAAQCSHSSNAFTNHCTKMNGPDYSVHEELVNKWENETPQGFGTVLVLAVNEAQMRTAVEVAQAVGYVAGVVNDPTYPLRDGDTTHFLNIDTCAYIFMDRNDPVGKSIVQNFPLHP